MSTPAAGLIANMLGLEELPPKHRKGIEEAAREFRVKRAVSVRVKVV